MMSTHQEKHAYKTDANSNIVSQNKQKEMKKKLNCRKKNTGVEGGIKELTLNTKRKCAFQQGT